MVKANRNDDPRYTCFVCGMYLTGNGYCSRCNSFPIKTTHKSFTFNLLGAVLFILLGVMFFMLLGTSLAGTLIHALPH